MTSNAPESKPAPEPGTRLNVYSPIPRKEAKDFFLRIGTAWVNRDGSINATLDALPTNGRLHLRMPESADDTDNS